MSKVPIFEFRARRTNGCTTLHLRSARIEQMVQNWGAETRSVSLPDVEGAHEMYSLPDLYLESARSLENIGEAIRTRTFDLALFALKGLTNGVTLKLSVPVSNTALRQLGEAAQAAAREFLEEYGKPIDATVELYPRDMSEVRS